MFHNVCLGKDEENRPAYSQYKGCLYVLDLWLVEPTDVGPKAVEGCMYTCEPHNLTIITLKDKNM